MFTTMLFFGCVNKEINQFDRVFKNFPKTENLNIDSDLFFEYDKSIDVTNIFLTDKSMILVNRGALEQDSLFIEVGLKSKKVIRKFVSRGIDFGKVYSPMSVGIQNGFFYVHDITLAKLLLISEKEYNKKEYDLDNFYYSVKLLDGTNMLASGFYHNNGILNQISLTNNKQVNSIGNFIAPNDKQHFNAWKSAYEAFLFLKPDHQKALLASRFTDLIRIFDLATGSQLSIFGPDSYTPSLKFQNDTTTNYYGYILTNETKLAFLEGTVSNKFIYLLYSGKKALSNIFSSNIVFIYDWQGNPIKQLVLNKYVDNILVSDDDKVMYAIDSKNHIITKTNIFK